MCPVRLATLLLTTADGSTAAAILDLASTHELVSSLVYMAGLWSYVVVESRHRGTRTCVLTTDASEITVPVFRSLPTTIKTSIHDTVLLPCFVENLGANGIRWWKDEKLLWDTSDPKIVPPPNIRVFPNQTLQVSDLRHTDTGDYICQVVRPDPWGPVNQHHAIEVLVPPHVKTVPESGELEVELGHEVIMGCVVTGVPTPIVSWSFKGRDMELINNRLTLRFAATDRKMSGSYQCTATNGVGDSAAATIRLKVLYRPEVGAERLWVHTSPGERAEVSCTVSSEPESKVEWFHEDKAVEFGDGRIMSYREGEKHKVIIKRVTSADLGFFTCRATNLFGRGQQSIHLSGVANPAVFKRGPKQSSTFNYTLIWEVESYSSIIEYKLLFKKHQVPQEMMDWAEVIVPADSDSPGPIHSQAYTLAGLHPAMVYEASVLSRNRFGWSRPSHIFRFATKGAEVGPDISSQIESSSNRQEPTFVILQNLSVKEEDLQELQSQDEVKEQELRDIIATKIENSQGEEVPSYEEALWGSGATHSLSLTLCFLTVLLCTFL